MLWEQDLPHSVINLPDVNPKWCLHSISPTKAQGPAQKQGQQHRKSQRERMMSRKQCFLDTTKYRHCDSMYKTEASSRQTKSQHRRSGKGNPQCYYWLRHSILERGRYLSLIHSFKSLDCVQHYCIAPVLALGKQIIDLLFGFHSV